MSVSNSVLIADAGNTCVKWTWFMGDEVVSKWIGSIEQKPATCMPDVIALASVRSEEHDIALEKALNQVFPKVEVFVIRSTAEACGVYNAYREPHRLGVDRWLAVVAAYQLYGGLTVIVDAGTAIKVDFVDATGKHLGGYIAPGLELMTESLTSNTARIRFSDAEVRVGEGIPNSTASAVNQGCFEMALGFVHRLYQRHSEANWVATGGLGEVLMQRLGIDCNINEHLVAVGAKSILAQRLRTGR
ncbi:type III pantothenate kinase [Marinomonas piezotolerans]|uniref:Type III pantothenate kinase n=1 Tax=Marinomonas piezotolerans TaxID=2213058 RepID=A0A370U597_9GAMM|nr:type III pantothenate kinase [Marinomonas piezotolerans]RDL42945.1 type III pantothenate kinase [Marinomonas piezotolerans]